MKKLNSFFLLLIATLYISSCKERKLATKIYLNTHEKFIYPEAKLLESKKNVGVAFSGGGSRASSLAIGQLRGLHKLGLLSEIKYISGVSGGAWASVAFTYSHMREDSLLGDYIAPANLVFTDLTSKPNGALIGCVSKGKMFGKFLLAAISFRGDEIFASILNKIYLRPLGINEKKHFGYNTQTTKEICSRNDNENFLSPDNFYLVDNDSRPYLLVSGTIVGRIRNTRHLPAIHFEMTPLYSGAAYCNLAEKNHIGGGYMESFAVDHRYKRILNDSICDIRHPIIKNRIFTLSDMMAISGNAPGTALYTYRFLTHVGLPEIKTWSPYRAVNLKKRCYVKSREYPAGDGGNLENLGLIPLLKRKVDKIIVFVNSLKPISKEKNTIIIDNALPRVFGIHAGGRLAVATNLLNNDSQQYQKLIDTLYKLKKAGRPIIYTDIFEVNRNSNYGIFIDDRWHSVEITWVYNDNFEPAYTTKTMNDEVRSFYYNKGLDAYSHHFPHLPTFLTSRRLRGIEYEVAWSNMLSHFSSWVVVDHERKFREIIAGK